MNKSTEKVELVETHNLALSLTRLRESPGYAGMRWRRALYHAVAMSEACYGADDLKKLREALGLP